MKCTEEHKLELLPPPDDFYRYADYVGQFGNPAKTKKRGHVVRRANRLRGVVVPGTERTGPWKLRRGLNSALVNEVVESDSGRALARGGAVSGRALLGRRGRTHQEWPPWRC